MFFFPTLQILPQHKFLCSYSGKLFMSKRHEHVTYVTTYCVLLDRKISSVSDELREAHISSHKHNLAISKLTIARGHPSEYGFTNLLSSE